MSKFEISGLTDEIQETYSVELLRTLCQRVVDDIERSRWMGSARFRISIELLDDESPS